uniref:Putative ovule protein n=1 Tax=Solanum chacoense TaxID=4108 RepID=A0A0V0HG72_SOLCH
MKTVLGARAQARSNKHRTNHSLSPYHFAHNEEQVTLRNVVPHSVATALAKRVFPVPGGPNIRTPLQGLLIPWKYLGIHSGSTTASCKSFFASFSPATSSHPTPGLVSKISFSRVAAC